MRSAPRRRLPWRLALGAVLVTGCVAAAVPGAAVAAPASPAAPSPPTPTPVRTADTSVTLTGHGWGHGRGMGQYGAYGYALQGQTYQWILGHYYGGTTLSPAPSATVNVDLLAFVNHDTIVQMTTAAGAANPQIQASWAGGQVAGQSALLIRHQAGGTLSVWTGAGCAGPWTQVTASVAGDVTITSATETSSSGTADMLQVCPPDGSRHWYQGSIVSKAAVAQTWNVLPIDQYVDGVVPKESPVSWGQTGGEAALEAQAVAARSYGLEVQGASGSVCDSTTCQVYGGRAVQPAGGSFQNLYGVAPYTATSDAAVAATAGQVLICNGSAGCPAGTVALAEFSSSTGGWTAGGTFPAVVDDGDGVSGNGNPNHTWTATLSAAQIQAAYPSIGTFQSINVTQRNGDGDLGGRVLQLQVTGTSATTTTTGVSFAGALGLKSNWFAVAGPPPSPKATVLPAGPDTGYWLLATDGGIFTFGDHVFHGSTGGIRLNSPILGGAPSADRGGYWLVAGDGGIFSFGDAAFYGSTGNLRLNRPVVGMAPTPDGRGYWLVAGDGGIFSFGDAAFYGSTGNLHLNKPIIGMAATPDGRGYWLVASDGGIFSFGDAAFYGSTGALGLAQPIVGMAPTSDGGGYWLVERDGTVFPFGDATALGSLSSKGVTDSVAGLAPTPDNKGYLLVGTAGNVYTFGDAVSFGGMQQAVPGYQGTILDIFG